MLSGNQKGSQSYTAEDIKKKKKDASQARGNRLVDKTTKQAAEGLGGQVKPLLKLSYWQSCLS